jgi:hypothetical protein
MMEYLDRFGATSELHIYGDIDVILNGKVTSKDLHHLDLQNVQFALGGSTLTTEEFIGETIVLNRIASVSYVDKQEKLITKGNVRFVHTPFLMGIPSSQSPDALIFFSNDRPLSLESLYQILMHKYPYGFALAGHFQFLSLETTYLKKAPIYEEFINGEKAPEYWAEVHRAPAQAVTFGVAISPEGEKKFGKEKMKKAFYQNPKEKSKGMLISHTHAALLTLPDYPFAKKLNTFWENISKMPVNGVRHMLPQSLVQEGCFCVFPLSEINI